MTVKDFKKLLEIFPEDWEIQFGELDFYRLKDRGGFVNVEFNQQIYKGENGEWQIHSPTGQ